LDSVFPPGPPSRLPPPQHGQQSPTSCHWQSTTPLRQPAHQWMPSSPLWSSVPVATTHQPAPSSGPSVRSLAAGHQSHAPGSSGGCVTYVLRLSLFAPQRSPLYISYCPAPGFECPPPREVIEHAAPMDGLNHRTHLAPHSRLFITHSAIDTPIANCNSDIPAVLSLSLSPAICFARAPARLPSPRGRKRPLRPFRITAVTQSQTSAERRFGRRGPPTPPPSPSRAPIRTVHLERN